MRIADAKWIWNPRGPKGCLVVLGATNCAAESSDVFRALAERRHAPELRSGTALPLAGPRVLHMLRRYGTTSPASGKTPPERPVGRRRLYWSCQRSPPRRWGRCPFFRSSSIDGLHDILRRVSSCAGFRLRFGRSLRWEADIMAFYAFHTLSFSWPAFRTAMLDKPPCRHVAPSAAGGARLLS